MNEIFNSIKLINGNCLEVMDKLISTGIKVDAIIADPPYGVTACSWDSVIPLTDLWKRLKLIRKHGANIAILGKQPFTTVLNSSNLKEFRYEVIWQKTQATNPMCARRRIMPIHENISLFYDHFKTYNPQMRTGFKNYSGFQNESKKIGEIYGLKSTHRDCKDGSRYPVSVLKYQNVRKGYHPTQKPLELMEYLVKTYTNAGDTVLDFCMGSGTTGLACKKLNRNFIGIEIDKNFFEIARTRINSVIVESEKNGTKNRKTTNNPGPH